MKNYFIDSLTIEESILATITWFSNMERPISFNELKIYLWRNEIENQNLNEYLEKLLLQGKIKSHLYNLDTLKGTYYALSDKQDIFEKFKKRLKLRTDLLGRAKNISYLLRLTPFIRGIYVCNSLSFSASKQGSDIDLFIVTAKNRMFICRLFVTLITQLTRMRRHNKKIEKRICLSFYTEENNINLKKIAIKDDIYLVYWIAFLKPISGTITYSEIIKHNKWIKIYLPNFYPKKVSTQIVVLDSISNLIKYSLEIFLNITYISVLINTISKVFQKHRARKKYKKLTKKASNIISNNMLKFHDNDRRIEYLENWIKKLQTDT